MGLEGVDIAEICSKPKSKRGKNSDEFDTKLVNLNWEHPYFHRNGESLLDAGVAAVPGGEFGATEQL